MKSLKKIVNHKFFFWVAMFFVITHFIFLLQNKYYYCLLFFSALCFFMKNQSKNLALALFVSVFISSFIFGCNQYREGMDNMEDINKLMKAGKVNANGLENIQKMMSQMEGIKKKSGGNMNIDMSSLNQLLEFNNKISSSNLTSKDDVKKAVDHLRANKELLKNMIDKF
tara:strand:+ start:207 stop:713 length:507 start_codon:yes stop_codon:yes gene_type:complete